MRGLASRGSLPHLWSCPGCLPPDQPPSKILLPLPAQLQASLQATSWVPTADFRTYGPVQSRAASAEPGLSHAAPVDLQGVWERVLYHPCRHLRTIRLPGASVPGPDSSTGDVGAALTHVWPREGSHVTVDHTAAGRAGVRPALLALEDHDPLPDEQPLRSTASVLPLGKGR